MVAVPSLRPRYAPPDPQQFADIAHAGGVARTELRAVTQATPAGELPFVDMDDEGAFRAEFRRHVWASYWCRGTVDLPDSDAVELWTDAGQRIPRDTRHRDGWDWEDRARRRVRVHGASCERILDQRATVRAIIPGRMCSG